MFITASILLSLFALSFLTYLEQWRGLLIVWEWNWLEIPCPRDQPRLTFAQVSNTAIIWAPCWPSLCPHLWPVQVRKEAFQEGRWLLQVISLQDCRWPGMAKWAQLSVSWDVCGYLVLVDIRQHASFPLGGRNMMYFSQPFSNIWSIFHFFTSCEF